MSSISDEGIVSRINDLSPTQFENLTLDLVRAVGFRNVIWRTPGADGGRDIQAEQNFSDLTGADTKRNWYIECKHYSSSVDWPTLWKKISYADSHGADFLLLVTNSQPSPQCETEISRWNTERRRPEIRVWRGYDFPALLRLHQNVALAHGLLGSTVKGCGTSFDIISALSKLVQAANGALAFDQSPELPLTAASALVELFDKRMDDLKTYGWFSQGVPLDNVSDWPWLTIQGDLGKPEEVSFRTIAATVRHLVQAEALECSVADGSLRLSALNPKGQIDKSALSFLNPILLLARCDTFEICSATQVFFQLRAVNDR
ncbi:restriction endonuclease [Salipiger abyssi]|uniref:restriction endonuclease n=1 Tax=Salipiger abyssi TaxID=1250539 RepID=UPI0018DB476B|nr:restriction endonuclease [Salipiger abyssi]